MLLIGDLLKQSERYLTEGLHPRVLVEGFEIAKRASLEFLETFKQDVDMGAASKNPSPTLLHAQLTSPDPPCLMLMPRPRDVFTVPSPLVRAERMLLV